MNRRTRIATLVLLTKYTEWLVRQGVIKMPDEPITLAKLFLDQISPSERQTLDADASTPAS